MASKGNVIGIVAWVLVAVLAIGAGFLGFLNQKQSKSAAGLREALVQVAQTAGVQEWKAAEPAPAEAPAEGAEAAPAEGAETAPAEAQPLTADALRDASALSEVLQRVQTAIQGTQQELTTTKDALTASQTEASNAKAEAASLAQQVQEQTAAGENVKKELAAQDEALAAAKAEAEKAAQDVQAAQEAADKQKAELEGTIEGLKAQMAEETARLQAELEAARTPPAQDAAAEAPAEPEPVKETSRVVGQSEMFTLIRYAEDQSLFLQLRDGQTLTYRDVPAATAADLIDAGDKLDLRYRFKIQDQFKSLPPDSVVVRKFWAWQRRHPGREEVRAVEPAVPAEPAADEASAEEVAPAEEPAAAEEAVPAGD
ncbi:MAG: hypothetical protein AB7V14_06035 [Kiritimatiellia bacterium]